MKRNISNFLGRLADGFFIAILGGFFQKNSLSTDVSNDDTSMEEDASYTRPEDFQASPLLCSVDCALDHRMSDSVFDLFVKIHFKRFFFSRTPDTVNKMVRNTLGKRAAHA
jgi:hypothetical protein